MRLMNEFPRSGPPWSGLDAHNAGCNKKMHKMDTHVYGAKMCKMITKWENKLNHKCTNLTTKAR